MYNRKYRMKSGGRNSIFDDAGNLGNLAIKAHEKGGMSLLLAYVGVVFLVITVFFIFINSFKIWTIIFLIISLSSLFFSVYLHLNKKKEFCLKCGKELIKKKSKEGNVFLACPGYPECRFTKSIY